MDFGQELWILGHIYNLLSYESGKSVYFRKIALNATIIVSAF